MGWPAAADTVLPGDGEALVDQIMAWLPGDYRTVDQPAAGDNSAAAPAHESSFLNTHIRPVSMPGLGEQVLFLEEYRGAASEQLERVRLYVLEPNRDPDSASMLVINPRHPDLLRGARDDLARVESLTGDELQPDSPGCRLTFRPGPANHIIGRMAYQGCRFREQWVDYEIHVGPTDHWVCYSRRALATDAVLWQVVPGQPCIRMVRQ